MKRTLTSLPALIRALGFITARQIEAHLPKPAGTPAPSAAADQPALVPTRKRAPRRKAP